jgi:hypothetical protein
MARLEPERGRRPILRRGLRARGDRADHLDPRAPHGRAFVVGDAHPEVAVTAESETHVGDDRMVERRPDPGDRERRHQHLRRLLLRRAEAGGREGDVLLAEGEPRDPEGPVVPRDAQSLVRLERA